MRCRTSSSTPFPNRPCSRSWRSVRWGLCREGGAQETALDTTAEVLPWPALGLLPRWPHEAPLPLLVGHHRLLSLIVCVAVMLPPRYSVLVATAIVLVGFLPVAFGEVRGADGRTRTGRCLDPGDRLEGRHEKAAGDIVGQL